MGSALNLADAVLAGSRLALARVLTQVENDTPLGREVLDGLFRHGGSAHLIGVTGSPGTGKSSLVSRIAHAYRNPPDPLNKKRVAVVAVDPTSPFTSGALLGDRVRMRELAGDEGVFIRSMASRGALGGLAQKTAAVVQVFDAAGYEIILIETVGAGQSEVDIARLAHTTLVVEAPGMGDDIQAIKAGILEIADILIINKADHAGVENTERALRLMLELSHPDRLTKSPAWAGHGVDDLEKDSWVPVILKTIATTSVGVEAVLGAIAQHHRWLEQSGAWQARERARLKSEFDWLVQSTLVARWRSALAPGEYEGALERLLRREVSPHRAVISLMLPRHSAEESDPSTRSG
jgi:LAO/AO transport system kinase